MNCYLDCNLVVFDIDKMMEGGWILRHWDVAWALDFRISSLTLSLGNVWPCPCSSLWISCLEPLTIEFILLLGQMAMVSRLVRCGLEQMWLFLHKTKITGTYPLHSSLVLFFFWHRITNKHSVMVPLSFLT
jgi:hypothetical protein